MALRATNNREENSPAAIFRGRRNEERRLMQKAMWAMRGVLAVVLGHLTFASPAWGNISLLQTLVMRG
ncbi:MAG: hypothetical protein ACYCVB_19810 [Bacilli bacterium]